MAFLKRELKTWAYFNLRLLYSKTDPGVMWALERIQFKLLRDVCKLTAIISEKMMEKAGCRAPLAMAHTVPTTKYGHSVLFNFKTFRKDTGGTFSS